MTAYTGTNLATTPRYLQGYEFTAVGQYALGGVALANGDTITFTNILPDKKVTILDFELVSPELDTNATPTGTISAGNSDSATGFATAASMAVNLSNSLAENLVINGNGALIGASPTANNRGLVLTVASAVATGATTGTITVRIRYLCGAF